MNRLHESLLCLSLACDLARARRACPVRGSGADANGMFVPRASCEFVSFSGSGNRGFFDSENPLLNPNATVLLARWSPWFLRQAAHQNTIGLPSSITVTW